MVSISDIIQVARIGRPVAAVGQMVAGKHIVISISLYNSEHHLAHIEITCSFITMAYSIDLSIVAV
jgi:hypothetical protein